MHDKFLNQRHGIFLFIAILDGIFFCSYGSLVERKKICFQKVVIIYFKIKYYQQKEEDKGKHNF
jgi:hypothetical protein